MKTKILTSILVGVLVTCFVSTGFAAAANGNGAGLERVPVFIGFRQTPGPSEQALVRSHGGAIKYSYTLVPAIAASIPEPAIQGLMRNPNVTYIEPVIKVYAVDAELDNTWGVKRIGAGTVHDYPNKGAGVKVAIIDTGIDYEHEDLAANYMGGYDFVNDDAYPMDDAGHGTHVAGTVAALDDGIGVVGVAPEAELYALKVLGDGGGSYDDVIAALEWAKAKGIQVTNNSYGSSGDPGITVETAFNTCPAVHVCAAGNSGRRNGRGDNVIYPARYASCIAVAATDSDNNRAYFSSTGPDVEISAPGVGINSTIPGGSYSDDYSGTSMASPHVAGVVALMMASSGGYSRETLQSTADDLGATGRDSLYGFGLVNAVEAVAGGGGGDDLPSVTIASPLDGATISGTVIVIANASDDNGVMQVEFFVGDGSIGVDTNGSNGWSASWVTTEYLDNSYTVSATATDTASPSQTSNDSVNVTVDNIDDLPSVWITNPGNGDTVSGIVSITASAEDDKGVMQVEFFVDGDSIGLGTYDSFSDSWSTTWDTIGCTESSHTVSATATDTASPSQASTSDSVNVTVDNSTPQTPTMYIWDIDFKETGPHLKSMVVIQADSDGDGLAELADDPLANVYVELILTHEFGDFIYNGYTDSNGYVEFQWKRAPSGPYVAEVTLLILEGYIWDIDMFQDNPASYEKY